MVKFNRIWNMPNSKTFSIKPIRELIERYVSPDLKSIGPFANEARFTTITNDLDPEMGCDYSMDALDFM